jgi:hypothetical protein
MTNGFLLAFILLFSMTARAQVADVEVTHECDTTWYFGYKGVNLYARDMHRIDIIYPSVDAKGEPITLSGSIIIPSNLYDGSAPVDGILLYNRYTQMTPECVPTRGFAEGEFIFMVTPLNPNWILVESDFYGFGVSDEHLADQYYVYGDANGHASIDCLIAARKILDSRNISQGRFLLNAGFSSGGYDAIATQRVRDLIHSDDIVFDKTIAGGAPFDLGQAYSDYIEHQDDSTKQTLFALIVLNTLIRHDSIGTVQDVFIEPLASKIDDWFNSGKYSRSVISDSLEKIGNKLSQFVQPAFLDQESDEYKTAMAAIERHNLSKDWYPDLSQRYYYMHYTRDNAVPINSGRAFVKFLSKKGFKKSVVPELTNLQTCMYVISNNHTLGGIHFFLHLAATLSAYPLLYCDGELNTYYYDFVKVGTPMGIIKQLEKRGVDFSGIVNSMSVNQTSGLMTLIGLIAILNSYDKPLQKWGTNIGEIIQIAEDSGLEMNEVVKIINYIKKNSQSTQQSGTEILITDHFYNYLCQWLNDYDI